MSVSATLPRTLIDKIWDAHTILEEDGQSLLYVDRHLLHDGSAQSFEKLALEGRGVRSPDQTIATTDHYIPTTAAAAPDADAAKMVASVERNAAQARIAFYGPGHARQGIAHVIGPELGITLPGLLVLCGDSHTSTHGALGAFAFGIGASEVAHVLATQTLWQTRPKRMLIRIDGRLAEHVSAKDLILHVIGRIGMGGAAGHVIEYAGSAVRALSVEARLTLCNMSIEAGSRAGIVAPDDTTFAYIAGRPFAPRSEVWENAMAYWCTLHSDEDATFDRVVTINAREVTPTVTWGTSPEDTAPIDAVVPDPDVESDSDRRKRRRAALDYMGLRPGTRIADIAIDRVFIGSCTNGRIEDLRVAAAVLDGRRARVPTLVVPGSALVKQQAEAEGLHRVFLAAGAEWRDPGCSMCVAINGADVVPAGERCASTSNRNFAGRQGRGARTHLMSPAVAAASAVTGRITDPRALSESSENSR